MSRPGFDSSWGGSKTLQAAQSSKPPKKRWLQKARWGAGSIQAKLDAPASAKRPLPPDFQAEPHCLNLGSNLDEGVYLGRLPHSPPPTPTPDTTPHQSGLSDGEDNLPERGGRDLRNNLFQKTQEASVNNQSVPQIRLHSMKFTKYTKLAVFHGIRLYWKVTTHVNILFQCTFLSTETPLVHLPGELLLH